MTQPQVNSSATADTPPIHPTTLARDPNLAASSLPNPDGWEDIEAVREKLTEMYGDKADAKEQEIIALEKRLIELGKFTHLLESGEYSRWKTYILDGASYLTAQANAANKEAFESKFQRMQNEISKLESYLKDEHDQGLFAVHAETGVRLYRKEQADGSIKLWVATPDDAHYTEAQAKEINTFIRKASGINLPERTFFQSAGQKDGHQLLACRITEIRLNPTDDGSFEYSFESKVGTDPSGALRYAKIRFTREQVLKGGVLVDKTRGFGYGGNWPYYIVKRIPFGLNPEDLAPHAGGPIPTTAKKADGLAGTAANAALARLSIPTPPPRVPPGGLKRAAVAVRSTLRPTRPAQSRLIVPGEPTTPALTRMQRFFQNRPGLTQWLNKYKFTRRLLPQSLRQVPAEAPPAQTLVDGRGNPIIRSTRWIRFLERYPSMQRLLNKFSLTRRVLPQSMRTPSTPATPRIIVPGEPAPATATTPQGRFSRIVEFMNKRGWTRRLLPKSLRQAPVEPVSRILIPGQNPPGTPGVSLIVPEGTVPKTRFARFVDYMNKRAITRRMLPKSLRKVPTTPTTLTLVDAHGQPIPRTSTPGRFVRTVQGARKLGSWLSNSKFGRAMKVEIYHSRTSVPGRTSVLDILKRQPKLAGTFARLSRFSRVNNVRWWRFQKAHPRIAGGLKGAAPAIKGTTYTAALVGIHRFCNGDYEADGKHSYLPSLLRGTTTHKFLEAAGFKTNHTTEEMGIPLAFAADMTSVGGDLGLLYGTAKGGQFTVWGTGRLLQGTGGVTSKVLPTLGRVTVGSGTGLVATSRGLGILIKGAGKVAGIAYAPYAGYTYFADGRFIEEEDKDLMRVGGTVGEGFVAGCMVGGPWGGVVGAGLSTVGAFKGAMDALDGVIEQGRQQGRFTGVKLTIKRGMEGFRLPAGQTNTVTAEAREYIDQVAKTQFIQDAIRIRARYGNTDEIPFTNGSWSDNFEEYDDFAERVSDASRGIQYYTDYGLWEGSRYSPLDDVPVGARGELIAAYRRAFTNTDSTKSELTRIYQTSWRATSYLGIKKRNTSGGYEDRALSGWQTFLGEDKDYSSKTVITDEMQNLATAYHQKGFARREHVLRQKLASGLITFDHPDIKALADEEEEFIQKRFPALINPTQIKDPSTGKYVTLPPILAHERGFSQASSFTTIDNSDVIDSSGKRLKCSEIGDSFMVLKRFGPSTTRMGMFAQEYHSSGLALKDAAIRKQIADGTLTMDSPEVHSLMNEQANFVAARIPNFFALIGPEGNRQRMEEWTRFEDPITHQRTAEIMNSLLVSNFTPPTAQALQTLANDFESSGLGEQEAALQKKLGEQFTMDNEEVVALIRSQRAFIESKMPNFFAHIQTKEGTESAIKHSQVNGTSPIMTSLVVRSFREVEAAHKRANEHAKDLQTRVADKGFQNMALGALEGKDKTDLEAHFSGEKPLSEERFGELMQKVYTVVVSKLNAGQSVTGISSSGPNQNASLSADEKQQLILELRSAPPEAQSEILKSLPTEADRLVFREFWEKGTNGDKIVEILQRVVESEESEPKFTPMNPQPEPPSFEQIKTEFFAMPAEIQEEILNMLAVEADKVLLKSFWKDGSHAEEAVTLLKEVLAFAQSPQPAPEGAQAPAP